MLWLKITLTGKQAHSAHAHMGVNALAAGAHLIVDLETLGDRFTEKNTLFMPATATFIPTKTEGGSIQVNQMPGNFTFYMDCRIISPYTPDEIQNAVRALADAAEKRDGVKIDIERLNATPAFPPTASDAPVVTALERAVRAQLGKKPQLIGIGGVTLATDLRARGLPVAVWGKAANVGSASNESVSISGLLDVSKVFARILFDPETAKAAPAAPNAATGGAR